MIERKVKGYIFQRNDGLYYGGSADAQGRSDATVYSMVYIRATMERFANWGRKHAGKWIIVYE